MAAVPSLIDNRELDFRFIDQALKSDTMPEVIYYDSVVDLLTVLFVPPEVETVVHFDDESDAAVLFEPESMTVVGFHIEAFRTAYLETIKNRDLTAKLKPMFECLAESADLITLYQERRRQHTQPLLALSREVHDTFSDRGLHLHPVPA